MVQLSFVSPDLLFTRYLVTAGLFFLGGGGLGLACSSGRLSRKKRRRESFFCLLRSPLERDGCVQPLRPEEETDWTQLLLRPFSVAGEEVSFTSAYVAKTTERGGNTRISIGVARASVKT